MRRLSLVLLLAGVGVLALTASAVASTVSLIWIAGASSGTITGLGTSDVTVSTTDAATLTLDVQMDVDLDGFGSGQVDFKFDDDLKNELNVLLGPDATPVQVVTYKELPGGGWSNPSGTRTLGPVTAGLFSTQESTALVEGQLFSFDAFTQGNGAKNTTLTFARMVFVTNPANVSADGDDIFNTFDRDPGLGFFSQDLSTEFGGPEGNIGASVNPVPEPGTLALLGLGVGALALAGRRRA